MTDREMAEYVERQMLQMSDSIQRHLILIQSACGAIEAVERQLEIVSRYVRQHQLEQEQKR